MMTFFEQLGYMAHGFCLLWQPWLIALYGGSDLLIFLAYMAIPLAILRFRRLRPDLDADHLTLLFAAFILLCGLTHLIGVITLWLPIYAVHAVVKALTAAVSVATAIVLFLLVPRLANLPSPSQLQAANMRLTAEIEAHKATLADLREARDALEHKVAQRTADLEAANERLTVLTRETAHRSKNMLAVVQSIARQTARAETGGGEFVDKFTDRLAALAAATDTVIARDEDGNGDLGEVIRSQVGVHAAAYPDRIAIDGPPVTIRGEVAQLLGLAVHELATNAVKHGALAGPEGRVDLAWHCENDVTGAPALRIDWRESGPEASVENGESPARGFGQKLLGEAVPRQLGGRVTLNAGPEGLHWQLEVPLASVAPVGA